MAQPAVRTFTGLTVKGQTGSGQYVFVAIECIGAVTSDGHGGSRIHLTCGHTFNITTPVASVMTQLSAKGCTVLTPIT